MEARAVTEDRAEERDPTAERRALYRLAAIVESSDDAIIGKDLSGVVTSWNRAAERMFGYRAEEMIGHPIAAIFPPGSAAKEGEILRRVARGERIARLETEQRTKDGGSILVSLTVSPVFDAFGRIVGASRIARDLSQREREHVLLQTILATLPDAVLVTDHGGVIRSSNAAAERMFGYSSGELRGRALETLVPPSPDRAADRYRAPLLAPDEERGGGVPRLSVGVRKDASTLPIEILSGEAQGPGQNVVVMMIRDVTRRRAYEQRFAEVQNELIHVTRMSELGRMASVLAHELSQPLAAMANYRSVLRELLKAGKAAEARPVVERIGEQAERAHRMVARLRALVRKGATVREPTSLKVCIDEAAALALVGCPDGITFKARIADDAADVVVDKIQIEQVLINLIRNAAEAMASSPRRQLSVTTARAGTMVTIAVADSGPGLPEEVKERLFQPFVTTKPDGLGVGLSVCRAIAEAHGGELSAADAPGGGAIFRLTLPLRADPVGPGERSPSS